MKVKRILVLAIAAGAIGLPHPARGAAPAAPPDPEAAEALVGTVRYLADPALEGRGVGTAGLDSAAAYIERRMAVMGLRPGGDDGGWFQPLEVTTGVAVDAPCAIQAGDRTWPLGDDFQPIGFSTNGVLRAPVVFAGYGITAPGFDYDDYAGVDVADKVVLVFSQEPGEMDSTSRFNGDVNTPHAELRTKAINAREHGALAMLVVDGPHWRAGEPLPRPRSVGAGYMKSGLIAGYVSQPVAEALLAGSGATLADLQTAIDAGSTPHSLALPESATVTVTLKRTRASIRNVVGWIPGSDTTRTLVVGAHYDHLGYGSESSMEPDKHVPHVGADDNASGTAALLGMAAILARRHAAGWTPVHNLVFCAFTGEEMGLVGSGHYIDDPTRPLETVEAMLNMDMVGRLKDNKLMVMGTGTAKEFPALLQTLDQEGHFDLKTSTDGFGPSDHSSFYKRNIPVLALFTGAHADYHKPSDTWDKINGPGLERVARFATLIVDSLDARPRPTYEKAAADSNVGRIAGGGGYGAYLGTIPDYLKTEGGVLLSGVREGGPADQAGIRGGDVVVRFDGVAIDNIYDYTYALRSRKPGQSVRITVKRDDQELELTATLGRRK